MVTPKNIGKGELEVLQYIHDHHPATVRQVADHFALSKGHVRTTVLNVMERLRRKGFLTRKKSGGAYHYSPKERKADFFHSMVDQFVQRALGGSVELMHANFPAGFGFAVGDPAIDAMTLAATYDQQKERSRKEFEAFANKARIPRASRQLVDSDPLFAIPHLARKLGADLVVMGAVSRSGIKRVFIGNTAERVLDDLPCDVLVVKPAHSAPRVSERVRGARVIPNLPLMPAPF